MGDESIYESACVCSDLFERHVSDLSALKLDHVFARELWGRFNLWAAYVGAFAPSKASLDARLVEHNDIKEMLIELLDMIKRNLNKEMEKNYKLQDSGETLEVLYPPEAEDLQGLSAVEAAVNQLHSLGVALRRSSIRTHSLNPSVETTVGEAAACIKLVKRRFKVDERRKIKSLWNHLGTSIHARGKAMAYRQRHNLKIASNRNEKVDSTPSTKTGSQIPDSKEEEGILIPSTQLRRREDAMSGTAASLFDRPSFDRNINNICRPSSRSTSQGSYIEGEDNDVDWYDYPRAPALGKDTKEVPCNLCSEPLNATDLTEDIWRSHVDRDLEPYVCISEECREPFKFFIHRHAWKDHMQQAHTIDWAGTIHNKVWFCDLDHDREFFDEREVFLKHLTTCHADVLTKPQILARARRNRTIDIRDTFTCPICDCYPPEVAAKLTEKPYEVLSKHIARHLKAIAFISLSYLEIYEKPEGSLKSAKSDLSHNSVEMSETSRSIRYKEESKDSSLSTMPVLEEPGYAASPQIPDDESPDWPSWMILTTYPQNEVDATLEKFAAGVAKQGNKFYRPSPKTATQFANEGHLSISKGNAPSTTIHAVLVAVDFGLTSSSVAYALVNDPENYRLIKWWPGTYMTSVSVPTLIRYNDPNPYIWGYSIDEEMPRHEWFKLGLAPELLGSGLDRQYPRRTTLPFVTGAACEILVTDYLRALRNYTEEYLSEKFGEQLMTIKSSRYILTVPAIWSEKAQTTLRNCAENAGMGNDTQLQIIAEPEAAALYALKRPAPFDIDDTFVICIAGAATVELASYTVKATGDRPVIYESAPGTGGLCGSTFLNRVFDHFLRDKFWNFPPWDEGYHREAMNCFETDIKKKYTGDRSVSFKIPVRGLPDNPALDIESNRLNISGKVLEDVFEPVVLEVLTLITAQIRNTPKTVRAVLLAGGFGNSWYLNERIKKAVAPVVEVVQILDGETAVVRGALLRGLEGMTPTAVHVGVDGRAIRSYYGTLIWVPYNPSQHFDSDPSKRVFDRFIGSQRVEVMNWLVRKGDLILESKPVTWPFSWDQKVSSGPPAVISITLYKCDDEQNQGAPKYQDNRVEKLFELKARLASIPESRLRRDLDASGETYYKLNMSIEMTCKSESLSFALLHDGTRYDTIELVL